MDILRGLFDLVSPELKGVLAHLVVFSMLGFWLVEGLRGSEFVRRFRAVPLAVCVHVLIGVAAAALGWYDLPDEWTPRLFGGALLGLLAFAVSAQIHDLLWDPLRAWLRARFPKEA